MRNTNIFFDMDGVLAVYDKNTVNFMYNKGFFLNRPPIKNMIEVVQKLSKENYNIYILSTIIDSPFCSKEKDLWLDEHLPEIKNEKRFFVPYGTTKADFAKTKVHLESSQNILIDDYTKNLREWEDVNDSISIKFMNGINGNNISKNNKFPFVDIESHSDLIVKKLKEIIGD